MNHIWTDLKDLNTLNIFLCTSFNKDFLKEKKDQNDLVVSYHVLKGELKLKLKNEEIKILEDQVIILSSVKDVKEIQISTFLSLVIVFGFGL